MKHPLLAALSLLAVFSTYAQTVFIPDPQLRAKLNAIAPGLVDGAGYMPEENADLLWTGGIDLLVDWSPADLTGIEALQIDHLNVSFSLDADLAWSGMPGQLQVLSVTGFPQSATWPQLGPNVWSLEAYDSTNPGFPVLPASIQNVICHDLPAVTGALSVYAGDIELINTGFIGLSVLFEEGGNYLTISNCPSLEYITLTGPYTSVALEHLPSLTTLEIPSTIHGVHLTDLPALLDLVIPDGSYFIELVELGIGSLIVGDYETELRVFGCHQLQTMTSGSGGQAWIHSAPALVSISVGSNELVELVGVSTLVEVVAMDVVESLSITNAHSLTQFPTGPFKGVSFEDVTGSVWLDPPPGLMGLGLENCPDVVELVPLPESLINLHLANCPISELPPFPEDLEVLSLWLDLTHIPPFPSGITYMVLSLPNLICMPFLPEGLTFFQHYDLEIACIPNHPAALGSLPWDLCTILNTSCPEINPYINGRVFLDLNENGLQEEDEPGIPGLVIQVSPANAMTGTDANGDLHLGIPIGEHTVSVLQPAGPPFYTFTPVEHGVSFTSPMETADLLFAAVPDSISYELSVHAAWQTPVRPGFACRVILFVKNMGNAVEGVVVELIPDPALTFTSSNHNSVLTNGNIQWTFDMAFGETRMISVNFITSQNTELGSQVHLTSSISPTEEDLDPANNEHFLSRTVVGSYDPNDKHVFPPELTVEEGLAGHRLEYLIRFQNTGTYLAERVLITDTLSSDLLHETIEFVGASHPCSWFYRDEALHVLFEDIMLPDSTSNEPESHGFVLFKMDTRDQLQVGDVIENIANIYFDFNEPVITDPAVLTVVLPTKVAVREGVEPLLYPVPASGLLHLRHDGGWNGAEVALINVNGRAIGRYRLATDELRMDLSGIPAGVYIVSCTQDGNSWSTRVIVE